MRQRILLGPAIALVALSACGTRSAGPASAPSPSREDAVMELVAHDDGPSAALSYRDHTEQGGQGSSCWSGAETGLCADVAGLPLSKGTVEIPRHTVLSLSGDPTEVDASVAVLHGDGTQADDVEVRQKLDLSGGEDSIDVPPGDYVLDVFARWDRGDSGFGFSIRVT